MSLEHLPHLLVEGKTDKYLVIQLLKTNGLIAHDADQRPSKEIAARIQLVVSAVKPGDASSGSKSELLSDISQRIRAPKHIAIGYILDADDPCFTEWNLKLTWESIRSRLRTQPALIQSPDSIPEAGFIGRHSKTGTPVGVWLMPDNHQDGSIEDFLFKLVHDGDTIASFAESSTRSAKSDHGALFPEKDFKKAVMETWLAWQEEPGMTFGTAFQKDCLRKNAPVAEKFVTWVKRLIADTSVSE